MFINIYVYVWVQAGLCVIVLVCMCAQRVKVCVCVSWDYFQYSRIFVYPQAHCLQTASQNDLELIALTFMCINTGCTCRSAYTQRLRVFMCIHTLTMCLGSDPLLPPALSVWLHKAFQSVCVSQFWCVCAASQMIAGVCEIMDATSVMSRSSVIGPLFVHSGMQ